EKQKQRIARYRSKSEMQNLESLHKKRIADFCDNLIRKQDHYKVSNILLKGYFNVIIFSIYFYFLLYGMYHNKRMRNSVVFYSVKK
ncbi:MAG: hypothetical protein LBT05_08520, partial [Planctomycetaceae bacterium]|nr:hypothetical protein [Planctomycetaceae bacterium]